MFQWEFMSVWFLVLQAVKPFLLCESFPPPLSNHFLRFLGFFWVDDSYLWSLCVWLQLSGWQLFTLSVFSSCLQDGRQPWIYSVCNTAVQIFMDNHRPLSVVWCFAWTRKGICRLWSNLTDRSGALGQKPAAGSFIAPTFLFSAV